ncbi:hypothetical protein CFter6_2315 [Collimonas fungivorans]|uniref:Uncharacterized protein n=2 Tax=Collimonas fungivorans TaxID=158899 RepID=A0A127PB08_9BURK|nr:hypothetical protein CFter6_2315 [Collimonas fungivorans]
MSVFDKTENILLLRGASAGDGESLVAGGSFGQAGLRIDFMLVFFEIFRPAQREVFT